MELEDADVARFALLLDNHVTEGGCVEKHHQWRWRPSMEVLASKDEQSISSETDTVFKTFE